MVNVNKQTLYFSDRPNRIAGNLAMAAYLDEWTALTGKDNFINDPPNGTLSIYEPGRQDDNIVVVEISNPVIDGKDLIYSYKLIEGTLAKVAGQPPYVSIGLVLVVVSVLAFTGWGPVPAESVCTVVTVDSYVINTNCSIISVNLSSD